MTSPIHVIVKEDLTDGHKKKMCRMRKDLFIL